VTSWHDHDRHTGMQDRYCMPLRRQFITNGEGAGLVTHLRHSWNHVVNTGVRYFVFQEITHAGFTKVTVYMYFVFGGLNVILDRVY